MVSKRVNGRIRSLLWAAGLFLASLSFLFGALACKRDRDGEHEDPDNQEHAQTDEGARRRLLPSVTDVVFLPDGKRLLSVSDYGVVLWDVDKSRVLRIMEKSRFVAADLGLSSNGKLVVGGGRAFMIWDVETGKMVKKIDSRQGGPFAYAISLKGDRVLVGGGGELGAFRDPKVLYDVLQVWDVKTGSLLHSLLGHRLPVLSVALSPDEKWALSNSPDGTVKLWNVADGKLVKNLKTEDKKGGQVFFSRDGKRAYYLGFMIKIWDLASEKVIESFEKAGPNIFAHYPPDLRISIVADNSKGVLSLWSVFERKLVRTLERKIKKNREILKVGFSPTGKWAAVAGEDQLLQVFDLETGTMHKNLRLPEEILYPSPKKKKEQQ
jgi:WD40 repeat protein